MSLTRAEHGGLLRFIAQAGELVGRLTGGRITPPLTMQGYAASAVHITLDIGKTRRERDYRPVMSRERGMNELRELASGCVLPRDLSRKEYH